MKIFIAIFLWLSFTIFSIAQPTEFDFVESNIHALFLGQAQINETPAEAGDWIAAFDSDGVCVGANPIIVSGSNAYFTLSIKGDDPSTTEIDEGMEENELFTIKIWDDELSNIISFPDNLDPTMFEGWTDNNGSPIDDLDDPADIYNFTSFFTLGCTSLSDPINGSINVPTTKFIDWFDIPDITGYKISIGDEPGNYNFLNLYDLGPTSSIYIDSFECNTTYYIKINTYNAQGEQINCQEEYFSTISNTAFAGADISICNGSFVQLSGSGGSIYKWSPSAGLSDTTIFNPIASPNTTTTYILTANHPNGCIDKDSVIVSVLPTPSANLTITNETTQGANNGSVFSNPTGAEEPYSFLWSNGSTEAAISNLNPGNYAVTVSSVNQCSVVEEFEILGYNCNEIDIFIDINSVSCHDDCDGSFTIVNVVNGTEPYNYLWSNGETSDTITGLCSGFYQLTVTDAINCTAVRSYIINNPDTLDANISSVGESYTSANNGLASSSPTGGTEGYFYLWSNGETTSLIDSLTPGNYSLSLIDAKGCTDEQITTISQYGCESFQVFATGLNAICHDECTASIAIDLVTGGIEPYTYQWSTGSVNSIINDLCPGTYTLTVTDDEDCHTFGIYTIGEPDPIVANLVIQDEIGEDANNGTATAFPTGGVVPYIYRWSTIEFTPSIENLSPGDYIISIEDDNECTVIDSFTIESYECPTLDRNKNFSNITCNGACDASIDYNISGGEDPYTFIWNNDLSSFSTQMELCPGTYIVTITDINDCFVIDTTIIDEDDLLELELIVNNETGNLTHDGKIVPVINGGAMPYQYNWSNGETSDSIFNLVPGEYSFTLTDNRNCQIIEENIVIEPFVCAGIEIQYFIDHIDCNNDCIGGVTITSISDGTFPFEYEWSSGEITNNINNKCGGIYSLTITDVNDCVFAQSFEIIEPDPFFIVVDELSNEIDGQSNGYIHTSVVGGTSPYQTVWNNGSSNLNLDNIPAGTYTVIITDANNCSISKTIALESIDCDLLTINADFQSNSCFDSNDSYINITIDGAIGQYNLLWSNGFVGENQTQLDNGTYSLTVTDDYCTTTKSFNITTPEVLEINYDGLVHITDSTASGAIFTTITGGIQPYEYLWTSGNGYTADTDDIDSLESDCYHLIVTDATNCVTDFDACISDFSTGVSEASGINKNIVIYPNPTTGKLSINIDNTKINGIEGMILEPSGKLIKTFQVNTNSIDLNLSAIPDGLYYLKLKTVDNYIYRKIYIQK